jgi:penicillin amidase
MARKTVWTLDGDGPIEIRRDDAGVPHVRAGSEEDALRGLGHCHGVDRAMQLVVTRIIGRGRASETLDGGEEMQAIDLFFRRIDLAGGAPEQIDALSARHRALLDAYADGVNRALRARRPWELRLLRHEPEPWTPADCVVMGRIIGYVGLAQTQGEVERWIVQLLSGGVPFAVVDELFGGRLAGFDASLLKGLRIEQPLVPAEALRHPAVPAAAASNNWAVAPSRTATGAAMFANDPHLEISRLPAVWYEAQLQWPDAWLAGASMPGVPVILAGRNDDVSWGVTYAYADTIDSWVEDCRDGRFRRDVDGEPRWEPFATREEVIVRRGGEPQRLTFHENLHGTLEGDPSVAGRYLATRWAGRDCGAASLAAALELPRARTTAEAGELLSRVEWAFNWVLADGDGSIAYRMSGRVPRRRAGASGLLPLAGWLPADDWQGFLDPDELPRRADPAEGWIATANEDLNAYGVGHPISLPGPAYRAERLAERLAARDDWTVRALGELQMDVVSAQARRFVAALTPLVRADERFAGIVAWDGSYDDAAHVAWFEAFYAAAVQAVLTWVCGADGARYAVDETDLVANYFWLVDDVLLGGSGAWAGEEGRDAALRRLGVAALDTAAGHVPATMTMRHLVLGGRLPRVFGFDRGPVALRGGRATLHQTQLVRIGGRDIAVGPSLRLVTDMAQRVIWTALPGGPSDRRWSRWYAGGVADWAAGRLKSVAKRES